VVNEIIKEHHLIGVASRLASVSKSSNEIKITQEDLDFYV
jgi:hypothetical protein